MGSGNTEDVQRFQGNPNELLRVIFRLLEEQDEKYITTCKEFSKKTLEECIGLMMKSQAYRMNKSDAPTDIVELIELEEFRPGVLDRIITLKQFENEEERADRADGRAGTAQKLSITSLIVAGLVGLVEAVRFVIWIVAKVN